MLSLMYVKFQKLLMTECRDVDKKHRKCPQSGVYLHCDPPRFFQKSGSLTLCKKIEKTNEPTQIIQDGPTDGQRRLLRIPLGKPWVQYDFS